MAEGQWCRWLLHQFQTHVFVCGIYGGLNGTKAGFTPRTSRFLDSWFNGRVSNSASPEFNPRTLSPEASYWVTASGNVILTSRFGLRDRRMFVTATVYWQFEICLLTLDVFVWQHLT